MWNLEYELTLILIVAAIIGWFMGRFVCKSNEHQERSNNKALNKENQRLEALIAEKDTEIHAISNKVMSKNDQIKELEHENNTANTLLETLKHEHESNLSQLQKLKPFQAQFEQLSQDYDVQSQQIIQHKTTLQKLQEELNKTQVKLADYTKKAAELEQQNALLNKKIDTLNHQLNNSQDEYGSQKDKFIELVERYNELKKEAESNQEKVEKAAQDKQILKQKISQITEENGDLISRLRAISSVVGAVGTEGE
ncbi:MAG TPA: DUF1049 domain-containing protein [Saprospiraceae bacterium]|nr:DUF1049 domain-containing protein [Saprospiraceae bacterium]